MSYLPYWDIYTAVIGIKFRDHIVGNVTEDVSHSQVASRHCLILSSTSIYQSDTFLILTKNTTSLLSNRQCLHKQFPLWKRRAGSL